MSEWIGEAMIRLGRLLGVDELRLNAQGAASVTLDAGRRLIFEFRTGVLHFSLAFSLPASDESMGRLLAEAHPMRCRRFRVRAGYLRRLGMGFFCVGIPENEVEVFRLNEVYEFLKVASSRVGGGAWA